MRERQRVTDLDQHIHNSGLCPGGVSFALLVEDRAKALSFHQPHREVHAPVLVCADLVDGHDARVIELAGDLSFPQKPAEQLAVDRRQSCRAHMFLSADDLHRQ